jgi:hypothetical protein
MYEWLSGTIGENAARIAGFVVLFALILLAIVVVLAVIRRLTGGTFVAGGRGRAPRLSVMDAAAVDSRRRLVLVRRDDVEHLILIGGPTDIVVEQNIVQGARANDRAAAAQKAGLEQRAEPRPAPAVPAMEIREAEPSISADPAPVAPVAPSAPAAGATPAARQQAPASVTPFPERSADRPQERARPAAAATARPAPQSVSQPAQAPAAPRPAPQFSTTPRPAPAQSQPRPATQQPAPQPIRAHPAYPLSQVAQGVISATSGLAAASASTPASLNIAPSRDLPGRDTGAAPRAPQVAKPGPAFPAMEAKSERTPPSFEAGSVTPFPSAPSAREDVAGRLDTFSDDDLHDALFNELSIDEPESDDTVKQTLSSELNISPTGEDADDDSMNQLEDEMEKLLGELSKTKRN